MYYAQTYIILDLLLLFFLSNPVSQMFFIGFYDYILEEQSLFFCFLNSTKVFLYLSADATGSLGAEEEKLVKRKDGFYISLLSLEKRPFHFLKL